MSVGNEQLLLRQRGYEGYYVCGVAHSPEAVDDSKLVGQFVFRCAAGCPLQERGDAALRVIEEHEDLPGVGVRVAEQFEAVGARARQGLLVAQDYAGGIILQAGERDQTAAYAAFPP